MDNQHSLHVNTQFFSAVKINNFKVKKNDIFLNFDPKHKLWVLVTAASSRRL